MVRQATQHNDLIVLEIRDIQRLSIQLAKKVDKEPELVAFIAKGSFLIGKTIADYFNTPLLEISAVRLGNKMKAVLHPVLRLLPRRIKLWLRRMELKSGIHEKNSQRDATINAPTGLLKKCQTILLVDDSVDTGHTIISAKEKLLEEFPTAEVLIASFFVQEASKKRVTVDYTLWENRIFSAPWSNDSREHEKYIAEYHRMKAEGYF